jgi:hypothetical protein
VDPAGGGERLMCWSMPWSIRSRATGGRRSESGRSDGCPRFPGGSHSVTVRVTGTGVRPWARRAPDRGVGADRLAISVWRGWSDRQHRRTGREPNPGLGGSGGMGDGERFQLADAAPFHRPARPACPTVLPVALDCSPAVFFADIGEGERMPPSSKRNRSGGLWPRPNPAIHNHDATRPGQIREPEIQQATRLSGGGRRLPA